MLLPSARHFFFSSLIDGCLKYKNKEKPKTGPRPGLRLNYDVIGPKPGPRGVKKSGPIGPGAEMQGSNGQFTLVSTPEFPPGQRTLEGLIYIYIYIYAFSRRFYPKRLTLHSSYSFYILSALAFPDPTASTK